MLLAAIVALLPACRLPHATSQADAARKKKPGGLKALLDRGFPMARGGRLYEWHGGRLPGRLHITIDLSEQRATLKRGGRPAGWTYVATGKRGYGTKPGRFRITEKVRDKVSTSWGQIVNSRGAVVVADAKAGRDGGGRFVGAPMPYWMRIYGAVGMHAGYIPYPGHPASHGCIRLPRGIAQKIFDIATIGTPVTIKP
jgi:lipoprotein-anchoring transpeptidase ErfK/SrfK